MRTLLVLALLALTGLTTGCGGYDYLLRSAELKASIANQVEVGLNEYHTAATLELDNAETASYEGQQESLLVLIGFLKAGTPIPPDRAGNPRTPEDVVKTILALAQGSLKTITTERSNENTRYQKMQALLSKIRDISAKDAVIVTRQQNDLEQLKVLAEEALRNKFCPLATPAGTPAP